MSPRRTFPRRHRLKGREPFRRVMELRCSVSDAHLIIYIARNELAHARVGLRVGRRLGRAPTRNRIKRLLREAFRLRGLANQHPGFDLVCIPRPGPERTSTIYEASLEILIPKAIHRLERRP